MTEQPITTAAHEKTFTIIVNGQEHTVQTRELSFDQIVALAYPTPPSGNDVSFSVTYRRAHGEQEGILFEGQSVRVKEGTIFNVTATNRS